MTSFTFIYLVIKNMKQTPSHTPKALKLIATIMVTFFFTGALIPSVIAETEDKNPSIGTPPQLKECTSYMVDVAYTSGAASCDTCKEAVQFAIDYMIDHVQTNTKGIYFLHTVDVSILIFQGLMQGFRASGYQMEVDEEELKSVIDYWVDTLVEHQIFTITKFLATFGSIVIGITDYLIHLCNGENISYAYSTQVRRNRPLVKIWNLVLEILNV